MNTVQHLYFSVHSYKLSNAVTMKCAKRNVRAQLEKESICTPKHSWNKHEVDKLKEFYGVCGRDYDAISEMFCTEGMDHITSSHVKNKINHDVELRQWIEMKGCNGFYK